MFSKRASYDTYAIDLGDLDPWQLTARQSLVLERLLAKSDYIEAGKYQVQILNKDHTISTYALTLRFPIAYHGSFDPSDISESNAQVISQLLKRANDTGMCKSGLQFVKTPGSRDIDVYDLRYTIVPRKKFANTTYYDLIGSGVVGEGAFGVVHPIIGTIKPRFGDTENLYFSPSENKRVMKLLYDVMFDDARNPKVEKEISLMRLAGYFKVRDKLNIEDDDCRVHMISMKRFPWIGLGRMIHLDKLNKINLSIDDRLRLSIKLLRGLQSQLHKKNIIHRDIKPDNIRVNKDKTTKFWEVNFIDLGLSISQVGHDEDACKVVGTPYYIAPEVAGGGPQSKQSDIYSLARSIGQLWRDKELKTVTPLTKTAIGYLQKRRDEVDIKYQMFEGLNMSDDLKESVESVIRSLSNSEPLMRADVYTAINQLEALRLDMVVQKTAEENVEQVRTAHAVAMSLATKLDKYASRIGGESYAIYKTDIQSDMNMLPDNPVAINIFIETLGVKCLYGCGNQAQLKDRIDSVFNNYLQEQLNYTHTLENLRLLSKKNLPKSEVTSLNEYLLICDKFRDDLCSNLILDLDFLADTTRHIKSKIKNLNAAYAHYQNLALDKMVSENHAVDEAPSRFSLRK